MDLELLTKETLVVIIVQVICPHLFVCFFKPHIILWLFKSCMMKDLGSCNLDLVFLCVFCLVCLDWDHWFVLSFMFRWSLFIRSFLFQWGFYREWWFCWGKMMVFDWEMLVYFVRVFMIGKRMTVSFDLLEWVLV